MNRNFSFYFLYLSESINVIMVDASIELVFEQVLLGVGGGGVGEGGGNYSTMQVKGRSSSFQH